MISYMKALKAEGYRINIYTARRMQTSGHDVGVALARSAKATFEWLDKYGVPYDAVYFGKPNGTLYIDDKSVGYDEETVYNHLQGLLDETPNRIQVSPLPKSTKSLTILRLCDQWNWAYDHITREQTEYSTHKILSKRLMDITVADLDGIDILYIPGPNMGYTNIRDRVVAEARKRNPKVRVVCGYAGEHELLYPEADIIVSISAKFYPKLKEMYKPKRVPVVFLPESADTRFFTPAIIKPSTFTVGWSGRVAEVKRCHLLDKLPFEIKRQSDHGKVFFQTPGRSLQPMKDFYQSLSALVLTSSSEAMPRVVLEAMACGIPVVATDVGSLRMLLPSEWLVPVNPEETVVSEMSKKLLYLKNNPKIAEEVGKRNRDFVKEYFSWEVNQSLWDSFFETVNKGHLISAEIYNREYRKKYSSLEPALLT